MALRKTCQVQWVGLKMTSRKCPLSATQITNTRSFASEHHKTPLGPLINYVTNICQFIDPLPPCVTFHNRSDYPPVKLRNKVINPPPPQRMVITF